MFVTLLSIYNPTITKAGAVAKDGIARKIGDKNRDNPKRIAVVTAVRPVLPPSDTPEALSHKSSSGRSSENRTNSSCYSVSKKCPFNMRKLSFFI